MTWPSWEARRLLIADALRIYSDTIQALPGINEPQALEALSRQFVASLRREAFYDAVQQKPISASRADPNNTRFDAERAVAYHMQNGNVEEAAWLIFLMTHFARPAVTGWLRLRDVYGRLGTGLWDYATVSANPDAFIDWLAGNWRGIRGKFGNHRKYESLQPTANRNMGRVVKSYVAWIGAGGHQHHFAQMVHASGNDPHVIFESLYSSMSVVSFGRLAKFDYLSLIGRYGVAPISAGSAFLAGATGPARGAKLLFDGNTAGVSSVEQLQGMLDSLDANLKTGMVVMEDALCNWQKSPLAFIHFNG